MSTASTLIRSLLIYSICLPLAIFLGYLLATPLDFTTFFVVGFVLFFLTVPIWLRWHRLLLIASWNTSAVLFFLPGRPHAALLMAWISFFISFGQYILNRRLRFLSVPSLTRPMIFLTVVVLVTAEMTGGFGLAAFGSESQGGKRYVMIVTAIIGYLALTSQRIPPQRASLYVSLFFLGTIAQSIGELAPVVTPGFYFLFLIFPVTAQGLAAIYHDPVSSGYGIARLGGVAAAALGFYCFMLARHGIENILTLRRPLRLLVFLVCAMIVLLGGYRSMFLLLVLLFGLVFYYEGLMRSRLVPVVALAVMLVGALTVAFVDRLPLSFQRSLSFLPLNVDPVAKMAAEATTEWRVQMWKHVLPEVPRHLLLGKGYSMSRLEQQKLQVASDPGQFASSELAGDYHNGPLSVILPLGIFGVIAFVWFLAAGTRVLYRNYMFGPPQYRHINTFLLAYFVAKVLLFFTVFGSIYSDLATFTGVLGLSVSLNGGMAKAPLAQVKARLPAIRLRPPAAQRPVSA